MTIDSYKDPLLLTDSIYNYISKDDNKSCIDRIKRLKKTKKFAAMFSGEAQRSVAVHLAPSIGGESASDTGISGARAMWRGVIAQAVIDATSGSKRSEDKLEREKAKRWLKGHSPDFLTVCSLAELNPDYVVERVKIALATHKYAKTSKSLVTQLFPE